MKKLLLLMSTVIIAAVSFASPSGNHTDELHMNSSKGSHMKDFHKDGCMMGMSMSPEMKKKMQEDMIKIQEKQLEINKIMITSNPDMKEVEKLNNEIYQIKANHMTEMQKNMLKTN